MAQVNKRVGWAGLVVAVACGGNTNTPSSSTLSTGGNGSGGTAPGSGGVTTSIATMLTAAGSNTAGSGVGGTNHFSSGGASTSTDPGGAGGMVTTANGGTESTGGSDGQSTGGTGGSVTGGSATGGSATGGSATGGNATGGNATGGSATGGSSGATGGGGSGGTAHICDGASCCQPVTLGSNAVWATVSGKSLSITLLVTRSAGTEPYWDLQADVSVPGGQATCNPSREPSSTNYLAIQCPTIVLDPAPTCDSTIALRIHLRSSTYASYGTTDATCAGAGSMEIELQQPVTCPACPASLVPPSNEPCEIPGSQCPASVLAVNCPCYLDRRTGERKWSCPTP